MQQVKEVARKWQGRSSRDAAAGRSIVVLKFKECLDAQL
jgi:hypothetical protein